MSLNVACGSVVELRMGNSESAEGYDTSAHRTGAPGHVYSPG
jgi:hypothetical protein